MNVLADLFLFNPDHDLALANYDANYMPPASARQLSLDLAVLPAWYAGKENYILASSAYNLTFLEEMRTHFPLLASLLTEVEVEDNPCLNPHPWGWDPAICKRLLQLGMSSMTLPSIEQLAFIRENSHRSQAVYLLKRMQIDKSCCGESFYITGLDELRDFVESRPFSLLKAPLSGSGKGLNWCKGKFTSHISHWCRNIIGQQGGVIAEPVYNKVLDFAMQFYADTNRGVHFSGYSLFQTDSSGAYEGNLLLADHEIEKRLTRYLSPEVLGKVKSALEEHFTAFLGNAYSGYLGVDMMVCRFSDSPEYRIHPCVEINLRMNMGMTARLFYDRFVHPDSIGVFKVDYFPSNVQLQEEHKRLMSEHPLILADNRITQGYMPLVPVTPHARYGVWVLINSSGTV